MAGTQGRIGDRNWCRSRAELCFLAFLKYNLGNCIGLTIPIMTWVMSIMNQVTLIEAFSQLKFLFPGNSSLSLADGHPCRRPCLSVLLGLRSLCSVNHSTTAQVGMLTTMLSSTFWPQVLPVFAVFIRNIMTGHSVDTTVFHSTCDRIMTSHTSTPPQVLSWKRYIPVQGETSTWC